MVDRIESTMRPNAMVLPAVFNKLKKLKSDTELVQESFRGGLHSFPNFPELVFRGWFYSSLIIEGKWWHLSKNAFATFSKDSEVLDALIVMHKHSGCQYFALSNYYGNRLISSNLRKIELNWHLSRGCALLNDFRVKYWPLNTTDAVIFIGVLDRPWNTQRMASRTFVARGKTWKSNVFERYCVCKRVYFYKRSKCDVRKTMIRASVPSCSN